LALVLLAVISLRDKLWACTAC